MPIFKSNSPNAHTTLKIWKITESFTELSEIPLNTGSKTRVEAMKSGIHQRGYLSVRHLLKEFGYTDNDLFYDDFGKPHLKDGKQVSITHSFEFSAIIVSDGKVGIDIEKQRPKIASIAQKFIGYEAEYLDEKADDYVRKLTTIWCIKESLYKLSAMPGLSFKQHTLAIPFHVSDEKTICWIDHPKKKQRCTAHFFELEEFCCAYTLPL